MVAPEADVPCAAGDHCTHPTSAGIVQLSGLHRSPHKCLECTKPIHCAAFCGKSVNDLKGNFDSSLLSIKGRQIFTTTSDEEGMTVCHTCLFRLRPTEMPALPALPAIVDEQRGVFPCAANTLCREEDDLIYPTTTTCRCINCNGTAHLGCVEDFKLQTPVELDKAIVIKDFLPAARRRIKGLASDENIMFCLKCQAIMLLKRTVPKAPTKAKRVLVPKNDIRIILRQVAVYHAFEFVFTQHIKSVAKVKEDAIFLHFNGNVEKIKGTVNLLIDGEGPFTKLYNSSQAAGETARQLVLNTDIIGKDSCLNFVSNEHFTAKWISTSGKDNDAVTGRQLWLCGEKVMASLKVACGYMHKLHKICTLNAKGAVIHFASGKNEVDVYKLINDAMYTEWTRSTKNKKQGSTNNAASDTASNDDDIDNEDKEDEIDNNSTNLLSNDTNVEEDWQPFGKNSLKAPDGWTFAGYTAFILYGPMSNHFSPLIQLSDKPTTTTALTKKQTSRAHQRLLEKDRANHQRDMGAGERGLSIQNRVSIGFMAQAEDEGDRRDMETKFAVIAQKSERIKFQLTTMMEFWKDETDIAEKKKMKKDIDSKNNELSQCNDDIDQLMSKKRKPNPIVTKLLEDAAKSMGIGIGKGRSMSTTLSNTGIITANTAKDKAVIQAWECRRPDESDDEHRHRRGNPPDEVCAAQMRVGETITD
jgi:hypothetical protein